MNTFVPESRTECSLINSYVLKRPAKPNILNLISPETFPNSAKLSSSINGQFTVSDPRKYLL